MSSGRTVLLTRPQPDADRTAALLRARGFEPILAPLMHIVPRPGALPPRADYDVLAFTSANGVRAAAALTAERPPCFAVGAASAAEADALGFEVVGIGGGDVASLAAAITEARPGRILHAAGAQLAGDLAASLQEAGLTCRRAVLYEAVAEDELPAAAVAAIESGLYAILLMSPRSAGLLSSLIVKAGLEEQVRPTKIAALSPAVAGAFAVPALEKLVSPAPRLPALIDFLSAHGT